MSYWKGRPFSFLCLAMSCSSWCPCITQYTATQRQLPSTSFLIHHSLTIQHFDPVHTVLLPLPLKKQTHLHISNKSMCPIFSALHSLCRFKSPFPSVHCYASLYYPSLFFPVSKCWKQVKFNVNIKINLIYLSLL